MALSKRGFRKVVVDGRAYFWRLVHEREPVRHVDVVTADAFVPGQRGQRLRFPTDIDAAPTHPVVTPRLVRWVIEAALAQRPLFTGKSGARNVTLSGAELRLIAERRLASVIRSSGAVLGSEAREAITERLRLGDAAGAFECLVDHTETLSSEALADVTTLATMFGRSERFGAAVRHSSA